MSIEEQATEVLRQAEASLRGLVSAAASAGDYANVVKITALAKALGEMVKGPHAMPTPASLVAGSPPVPKSRKTHAAGIKASKPGGQKPRILGSSARTINSCG